MSLSQSAEETSRTDSHDVRHVTRPEGEDTSHVTGLRDQEINDVIRSGGQDPNVVTRTDEEDTGDITRADGQDVDVLSPNAPWRQKLAALARRMDEIGDILVRCLHDEGGPRGSFMLHMTTFLEVMQRLPQHEKDLKSAFESLEAARKEWDEQIQPRVTQLQEVENDLSTKTSLVETITHDLSSIQEDFNEKKLRLADLLSQLISARDSLESARTEHNQISQGQCDREEALSNERSRLERLERNVDAREQSVASREQGITAREQQQERLEGEVNLRQDSLDRREERLSDKYTAKTLAISKEREDQDEIQKKQEELLAESNRIINAKEADIASRLESLAAAEADHKKKFEVLQRKSIETQMTCSYLQDALLRLRTMADRLSLVPSESDTSDQNVESIVEHIEKLTTRVLDKHNQIVGELTTERDTLKDENHRLERARDEANMREIALSAEQDRLSTSKRILEEAQSSAEQQLRDLRDDAGVLRNKLHVMESDKDKVEEEVTRLTEDLANANNEIGRHFHERAEEAARHVEVVNERGVLRHENRDLSEANQRLNAVIVTAEERIRNLTSERDTLQETVQQLGDLDQSQVQQTEAQHIEQITQRDHAIRRLQTHLDDFVERSQRMEREIQRLQDSADSVRVQNEGELNRLQGLLNASQEEATVAISRVDELQSREERRLTEFANLDHQIMELTSQVDHATDEIQNLSGENRRRRRRNNTLRRHLDHANSLVEERQREIEDLQMDLSIAEQDSEFMQADAADERLVLEDSLHRIRSQHLRDIATMQRAAQGVQARLVEDLSTAQRDRDASQSEMQSATEEMERLDTRIQHLRREIDARRQRIDELEGQNTELEGQKDGLQVQKNDLTDQINDLTNQNVNLLNRNNYLRGRNGTLTDQNRDLTNRNNDLRDRNNNLKDQKDQLTDQNNNLRDQNDGLTDQNNDLAHEKDSLAHERNSLAHERDSLAREKDSLSREYNEFRRTSRQTEANHLTLIERLQNDLNRALQSSNNQASTSDRRRRRSSSFLTDTDEEERRRGSRRTRSGDQATNINDTEENDPSGSTSQGQTQQSGHQQPTNPQNSASDSTSASAHLVPVANGLTKAVWRIDDVRSSNFDPTPLPRSVLNKLRECMQDWDSQSAVSWERAPDKRNCVRCRIQKRKSEWIDGEDAGCKRCGHNHHLCVVVSTTGEMELLATGTRYRQGNPTPSDEAYWMGTASA